MKIKDLTDIELIEYFERTNAFGCSDYIAVCKEFYVRFKFLVLKNMDKIKQKVEK